MLVKGATDILHGNETVTPLYLTKTNHLGHMYFSGGRYSLYIVIVPKLTEVEMAEIMRMVIQEYVYLN